jgi:hypothetical protein
MAIHDVMTSARGWPLTVMLSPPRLTKHLALLLVGGKATDVAPGFSPARAALKDGATVFVMGGVPYEI